MKPIRAMSRKAAKQAAFFIVTSVLALPILLPAQAQESDNNSSRAKKGHNHDGSSRRALEILRRMVTAMREVPFIAREVTLNANGRETEQWVRWHPKRGMRRESIRPKAGEILIDNLKNSYFYSERDHCWYEADSMLPKPGGRIKDSLRRLSNGGLNAEVVGDDRIAGREADIVRVKPVDGKTGPARRFWLDRATGIKLKSEEMGPDGRLVSSSYFLSLDLNPRFDDKDFERPRGEIRPARDRGNRYGGRDGQRRDGGPRKRYQSIEEAVKDGVKVAAPGYLPPGFVLRQVEASGKEGGFVTLRYANGLSVVSLTRTSLTALHPKMQEKLGKRSTGFLPNPRGGNERLYVWRLHGKVAFLFSNLPEDQVKRIAASVR